MTENSLGKLTSARFMKSALSQILSHSCGKVFTASLHLGSLSQGRRRWATVYNPGSHLLITRRYSWSQLCTVTWIKWPPVYKGPKNAVPMATVLYSHCIKICGYTTNTQKCCSHGNSNGQSLYKDLWLHNQHTEIDRFHCITYAFNYVVYHTHTHTHAHTHTHHIAIY